ncbi:MAG: hypothetical protein A2015_11990 [Spirochaetes bacterium GWF1_31_7]|nr:MAG: hypothetical protein A2Y30_15085 [Spirochaetes bacterium GWE1_32_154]OHD49137.1 MAG: hypothetical protein A2015_11990 [Spirochaetes bacterium GWF1_31_7]OHD50278.1 MAG: hypothetical protein A2Y29_13135 [Spirochaetes bacterium GWE2_31_10]HBD93938.1 hypothetical protein [Spirochaetia bacterium]HBI38754.1 hypothetical protein [Spirochaetia bacterium]
MDNKVKIGLIQSNNDTALLITNILLNYGVPTIRIDPVKDDIIEKVSEDVKFLFVDFDFSDNASLKALIKIGESIKPFPCLIIGTSFNATPDLINTLQHYNLISFLVKPVTADMLKIKFKKIIDTYGDHFPTRRHIRIKPDADESMRASFKFNDKFYSCKVIDISLGGIAAEVYSNVDVLPFEEGNTITGISINLGLKDAGFNAEFVSIKSKFISLKFIDFASGSYEIMSKYILSKISV